MDGYIRVSRRMGREGPGYISPDVQRESIQRWSDELTTHAAGERTDPNQTAGARRAA